MPEFTVLLTVVAHAAPVHRASFSFAIDLHEPSEVRDLLLHYVEDLNVATHQHIPDD